MLLAESQLILWGPVWRFWTVTGSFEPVKDGGWHGGREGWGRVAGSSQPELVFGAEAMDRPHLEDRGRGPPALQLSVTPTPPWGPRLHVGCEAAVKRRSGPSTPTGPLPGGQKYALKLEFYANTYRTDFLLPCVIIVQLPGLPGGGGLGSGVCCRCRWHALDDHSLGPRATPSGSKGVSSWGRPALQCCWKGKAPAAARSGSRVLPQGPAHAQAMRRGITLPQEPGQSAPPG